MEKLSYEIQLTIKKAPINPVTYKLSFNPADYRLQEHISWLKKLQEDATANMTGESFINVVTEQGNTIAYHFDSIFGVGMANTVFEYCGKITLSNIIAEVDKGILYYNNYLESQRRIKPSGYHSEIQSDAGAYHIRPNKQVNIKMNSSSSNYTSNANTVHSESYKHYRKQKKYRQSPGCLTVIVIFILISSLISLFISIS